MTQCWALGIEQNIDENDPLTPEEQRFFDIDRAFDEAFRRGPSIVAMNRVYRMFRTDDAETDRAIRDHIGLLYLLEQAKPVLREAMREGKKANGLDHRHRELSEMEVASL